MIRIRFGGSRARPASQPRSRLPGVVARSRLALGHIQAVARIAPHGDCQTMPEAPVYREFSPGDELAPFVRCIWTFVGPADFAPQPIAPDGRPELIVHLREPYLERGANGDQLQPQVLFAGQLTRPLTLVATGEVAVVGVRFHAFAARAFLGADAAIATDARLALTDVHGEAARRLQGDVMATRETEKACSIVERYVAHRLRDARLDEDVRWYVERLFEVGAPHKPANASERQWQRRFKGEVGVSARMLQAILRFRRIFDSIEHPPSEGWVGAALAAGYFDQPQMARDFRRFLGCTARQWAVQRAGLARSLTEPVSVRYKTEAAGED